MTNPRLRSHDNSCFGFRWLATIAMIAMAVIQFETTWAFQSLPGQSHGNVRASITVKPPHSNRLHLFEDNDNHETLESERRKNTAQRLLPITRSLVSLSQRRSGPSIDQRSSGTRLSATRVPQTLEPSWSEKNTSRRMQGRVKLGFLTVLRVVIPSVLAGFAAFAAFPSLSLWLCSLFADQGVFAVLSQDSSQFVQNFLSVSSLLFSILVGQTYYFMYQQQEMVYYALFDEVTEAKSLLEQVALVSQGRSMYARVLGCMSTYVENDLKALSADPAVLLSSRPMDDPLETIMYLTSVGVPGAIYDTVRSLRQARARRLGALQRKLPSIHMIMLWILAALELVSFPLLGAGTQTIGGYNVLTIEGVLFGVMTGGIVLTLRVVSELWRPAGGAYNVDGVLRVMVRGLEKELEARTKGLTIKAQLGNYPSSSTPPKNNN